MNVNQNWCVYMHIAPNGKKYIGITGRKPKERWKNGHGYIHNEHFNNAIKKYSWENFQHKILFKNVSKDCAVRLEQICIVLFKTYDRRYGYNKTFGGEHPVYSPDYTSKNGRKIYCLETNKIYNSAAEAQRELNFSTYSGIIENCNEKYKHVHGYHFCDIDKIDILKRKYENKLNTDDKRVYCFTNHIIYNSTGIASKMTNTPLRTIQRRCSNNDRRLTNTGFSFCYYYNLKEDEKSDIESR